MSLYLVGGIVRDLLLGISSSDLDLVVEGNAILLAQSLATDHGGKVTAHTRFRTANIDITSWKFNDDTSGVEQPSRLLRSIDLISARKETYPSPASLPRVNPGTILDDLQRRDFTINAMAIRLDGAEQGTLMDPLGGQSDLLQEKIRVLHTKSFVDDPTRIFRAFRYEQRFKFKLATESLKLIPGGRKYIKNLSPERLRHELDLILEESTAPAILARLAEHQLLTVVHAALRWNKTINERFKTEVTGDLKKISEYSLSRIRWVHWMLTSTNLEISSLNARLHFDAPLYKTMIAASKLWKQIKIRKRLKPSQWVEMLEKLPALAVLVVYLADKNKITSQALLRFLLDWRHVKQHTTGHKLKELGIKPGEKYAIILKRLRSAWLDGEISTPAHERQLLEKLIQ
jgi:tRNA nucleotidyltransferase (CCA-adding enzyme)